MSPEKGRKWLDSPGHFHQGHGHSGSIDGQVSVEVHNEADVEHIDANCRVTTNTDNVNLQVDNILSKTGCSFFSFFFSFSLLSLLVESDLLASRILLP